MRPERRAARPPLEGAREAPFFMRADDDDPNDGRTLDGYGAVFGTPTIIDSWEGRFQEQFVLGSMKRSFRETPPRIQFDHGRHPLIGSIPIAALRSISEDTDPVLAPKGGAHIIGRVFDNWLMEPVRDAIAAEAVNGMSMRFSVVREQWERPDGSVIRNDRELAEELERTWREDVPEDELLLRTIKEAKIPEMGPVVWPAYEATSVSVRSKIIDLGRLNDPEQRKLLATAVFLADTAEQDAQRDADAVEHPSTTDDAQRDTPEVVELPSPENPDAQRSTPVGEPPSKPKARHRLSKTQIAKDMARTRNVLLSIDHERKVK